jgi:hypothetical protein
VNEKSADGALQRNDAADPALSFPKPGQSTGVPRSTAAFGSNPIGSNVSHRPTFVETSKLYFHMTSSTKIPCWDQIFGVWSVAAAGGVVAAAALILWWAYFSRITSPPRFLLCVCAGLVFTIVGLLIWREHRDSVRAENLAALNAFNSEADQLFQEGLGVNSADDYSAYQAKADGFSKRLQTWVSDNLGPRASDILHRHDPKDANVALESALDKNHESSITAINQTKKNIVALLHAGTSDKCVKPTASEHPIPQPETGHKP